jgi:hypothetical protein
VPTLADQSGKEVPTFVAISANTLAGDKSGQNAKASRNTNKLSNPRKYFADMKFGSRELKVAVVLVLTMCWLLVILARSQAPRDPASFEGSSLVGLAQPCNRAS